MGGAIFLNDDAALRARVSQSPCAEKSTHGFQGVDESSGISESFTRRVPVQRGSFF
jgi:hypothetical protein